MSNLADYKTKYLIYKATDVLSFAQPALAVAGAGIISFLAVDRGLSFWIALPLGIFITGILGLVIERTFLRAMVGEPVFSVAILTIGIDILIRTVLDDWIGLNPRYMGDSFSMMGNFGSLNIGGVSLKYLELTALVAAIFVIGLLTIFFKSILEEFLDFNFSFSIACLASISPRRYLAQVSNTLNIFVVTPFDGGIKANKKKADNKIFIIFKISKNHW